MNSRKAGRFEWEMMELPNGITTTNGNWYNTTADKIEKYTPGLLQRYSLKRIIGEADAWVKSADGLALFLFFILAYAKVPPLWAFLISIIFFLIWYFNTSTFVNLASRPIIKTLNNDGFVYIASAVLMIGIALNELITDYGFAVDFDALWYGIVLFFLFKVGLLRLLIRLIQSKKEEQAVEMPDRILNMLLIRYGMKTGILTGEVKKMQDDLVEIANYHKTKKKKKK